MASKSSRRKNATSVDRDNAARILCDGASFDPVSPAVEETAGLLTDLGLIRCERKEYVLCCHSTDADYQYSPRTCSGRVYLDDNLDEAGNDFRCTHCERVIYPRRHNKARFAWMRAKIDYDNVLDYIQNSLDTLDLEIRAIESGLLRISTGGLKDVHLCIVDICLNAEVKSVEWARQNLVCYIVISDRALKDRFLNDKSLQRVSLADIVSGENNLCDIVTGLISDPSPVDAPALRTPVYSNGNRVITENEARLDCRNDKLFVIEIDDARVFVNGVEVLGTRGKGQYPIIRILHDFFLKDLVALTSANEFKYTDAREMCKILSGEGEPQDEDTVRRYITRLRTGIVDKLRESLGSAIEENDIIEIKPNLGGGQDEYGYRLNPKKVAIRPRIS